MIEGMKPSGWTALVTLTLAATLGCARGPRWIPPLLVDVAHAAAGETPIERDARWQTERSLAPLRPDDSLPVPVRR